MPKIHEIIVMQMLDDDRFRSSINEALSKAGVEVTIPGRAQVKPAIPYATPPQLVLEASSWRMLTADELIQDGDQWAPLKEPDRWRPVGDSVGTRPSNWTKSHFRRMVGVDQMETPIHYGEWIDDPFPAIYPVPRFPLDGEMVWIGSEEHHELAIYRGVGNNDIHVLKYDTVEGSKFAVGFTRLSDAPKHWLVGYECFCSDDSARISRNDIDHVVVTEINESSQYTFRTGHYGWLYARIAEPYYRTKIAEAMESHSAMNEPHEIQPTEVLPRLRICAGESLRGVNIGDIVWIGENPHPAIFRGLLTGSNEFSFDTENGVERARWFVRLDDADPAWLVGHMCRCSDVNNVPLDTSPSVRIVRYLEGDMFPFRGNPTAWRYGRIDDSHYINLIREAMINLAVDQRMEQEAPF